MDSVVSCRGKRMRPKVVEQDLGTVSRYRRCPPPPAEQIR